MDSESVANSVRRSVAKPSYTETFLIRVREKGYSRERSNRDAGAFPGGTGEEARIE